MIDIWKSLIEHILGWPVAAIFLAFLLRKPLADLIGRIISIKAPGFDVTAEQPSALAQIAANVPPSSDVLKGEIGSTTSETAIVPTTTGRPEITNVAASPDRREAVRKFGEGIAIVDEGVNTIKAELNSLAMPLGSVDTGEILVRHLATTQLMVRCERTHRLIFGSQLVALHMMNNAGPQAETALRPIFENARAKELQFYGSYTFENWVGFLFKEVTVIKTDQNLYAITVYGQSYLQYIGVFTSGTRPH